MRQSSGMPPLKDIRGSSCAGTSMPSSQFTNATAGWLAATNTAASNTMSSASGAGAYQRSPVAISTVMIRLARKMPPR